MTVLYKAANQISAALDHLATSRLERWVGLEPTTNNLAFFIYLRLRLLSVYFAIHLMKRLLLYQLSYHRIGTPSRTRTCDLGFNRAIENCS